MILAGAMLVMTAACQKYADGVTTDNTTDTTTEPDVEEVQGLVLHADIPVMTRTSLTSDFKLNWTENDALVVFNAPTDTDQYSEVLHYVIDEAKTGKFVPEASVNVPFEDGVNYDWYVCAPWRAPGGVPELVTPVGQGKEDGYFPIGTQTQKGNNNSEHISGTDIMVGKALDTRTPKVTLKHLAVLHKFKVTNASTLPTIVKKLTLNGGDNMLVGTFWIDLTADNPVLDINRANGVFSERALTITNPTAIKPGESVDLYMMTAPFTLNEGETLKIIIETTTGTQVLEKTATSDIVFAAGTYNTANLTYDYTPEYLYYETFGVDNNLPTTGNQATQTTAMNTRWENYIKSKSGLSVYDGDNSSIGYQWENCLPSAQESTAFTGMENTHIWFITNKTSQLTVSGIKLYGKNALTLSFVMSYNNAGLKLEYCLGGTTEWRLIDEITLPATSAATEHVSREFNVEPGYETISLRFTRTNAAPRIDNIKLTWQAEE